MNCSENSSHGRRAIGGYFELELRRGGHYHTGALRLNTARNCLEYVLRTRRYTRVHVPYYTCGAVLEPLRRLDVTYEFYAIDGRLEPKDTVGLKEGEAFLYTNYFGLKQECVERLAERVEYVVCHRAVKNRLFKDFRNRYFKLS